MTAITLNPTTETTAPATTVRRPSWRYGIATGAVAAVATTVVAVALRAIGVPLDVDGEAIPILGFAQMVLIAAVIGTVMARHMARSTFVKVAVALTVLSFVPDLLAQTGTASKLGLMLTHVVAAAIAIPRLAAAQER